MKVVHAPSDGNSRTLATDVEVADSFLGKARGLMGHSSVPEDYALVFPFDDAGRRSVHMLFVGTSLDVLWVEAERVRRVETLPAWRGFGIARADTLIELAPGAAEGVSPDDRVRVVDD